MVSTTVEVNQGQGVLHSTHDEFLPVVHRLRSASLADGSVRAYERAVRLWKDFCHEDPSHSHHSLHRRSHVRCLDRCVSLYLGCLYQRGGGRLRQLAVSTVYGLCYYYPALRGQLVESRQMLRGWTRLHPSVSHPPLTWPLVTLIAVTMALNGYGDGALATLVSFDALLRITEMGSLRVSDVAAPSDPRRGRISSLSSRARRPTAATSRVLLRLRVTKTGSNQWVELTNPDVERLLLHHISGRDGDEFVFSLALPGRRSGGTREYRHYFRATCRSLRLESCRFTPHSLRHGGATYALVHLKQSIETVMLRGRWQAAASCRTYLQAGRARQLDNIIDPSVLSLANQVADDWYSTIHNGLRRQSR